MPDSAAKHVHPTVTLPDPNSDLNQVYEKSKRRAGGVFNNPYTFSWWFVALVLGWIWVVYLMQSNSDYTDAWRQISKGLFTTIVLASSAYLMALIIGLFSGLVRAYPPEAPDMGHSPWHEFGSALLAFFRPSTYIYTSSEGFIRRKRIMKLLYVFLYNAVTFYVEIIRGIPAIVQLLIAGFIIVPLINEPVEGFLNATYLPVYNNFLAPLLNGLFNHPAASVPYLDWLFHSYEPLTAIRWRGVDIPTGTIGLGIVYGAFLAEVFRAGIQSVAKGQVEAAKSLGMTTYQTMSLIVIPQAVRNVLPTLGNELIAMIKDTSLVTILGMNDMTQEAKKWSGSQFTYIPTYLVLSLAYLTMTVLGSLYVQGLERRLRGGSVQQLLPWWVRLRLWLFGR
jgi:polar amino acid transport system permease protein